MFSRALFLAVCLVPCVAVAGPEEVDFGPGLYWRYLIQWKDDTDTGISYSVEGFRDSGVFTRGTLSYGERIGGEVLPPPMRLFASNFDEAPRLDTDGDFDIDITDLNNVRNEFGEVSPVDLTGDGIVGIDDLNKVRNEFGFDFFRIKPAPWEPPYAGDDVLWVAGDVLDDCIVLLDARIGPATEPCAEFSAVPEPSAFALAAIALMALPRRIWTKFRRSPSCTTSPGRL